MERPAKRADPTHKIDALIAALGAACASWPDPSAHTSARRIAEHAVARGFIPQAPDVYDANSIDALIDQLRSARNGAAGKTTILIVEDDRLTARVLADLLASPARTVLIASSAAEATRLIRAHDVSLILLDLVLPDGDGRDLLTRIRTTPATRVVPVMVITARTDDMSHSECFALGADALLPKPVQPSVLQAAVSAQLAHSAERRLEGRVDGLTMLPNRTAFMDALGRAVPLAQRTNQPLAAAMIDLDHFKSVNDTHGHAMGDEVLQTVAQTIANTLRTSDLVARWGGEEMCVLMADTTASGGVRALEKALNAVRELEFKSESGVFGITFSAGLAPFVRGSSSEELLKEADRLLYVAKTSGRNRIISPADEADPPRPRALLVEDDLAVSGVVTKLLEREGFSVAHFADGGGVLEAAQKEHFVVAIIDLGLPVMNGFELVTSLRKMATAAKLPILFLTGSDDEDDVVHGFEVGANDYLVKPFHARELVARITRLLPKRINE